MLCCQQGSVSGVAAVMRWTVFCSLPARCSIPATQFATDTYALHFHRLSIYILEYCNTILDRL